jgi:hypothetical protein
MLPPLTLTTLLKLLWDGIRTSKPKDDAITVADVTTAIEKVASPRLVVSASDHSYREARFLATTAILCTEKGRKPTLHEDHYPDQPPETGFDVNEKMKLTRVTVLLVQ